MDQRELSGDVRPKSLGFRLKKSSLGLRAWDLELIHLVPTEKELESELMFWVELQIESDQC